MMSLPKLLLLLSSLLYGGCCCALAFSTYHQTTPPLSFFHHERNNRCTDIANTRRYEPITSTTLHSSSYNNDDIENNEYNNVNVAGVSVSPLGFLVILQSAFMSSGDESTKKKKTNKMAFPISLTSIPPDSSFSITNTNNITSTNSSNVSSTTALLPSLFQENNDQTSVTSPEALTFLQLLNGVDMATPILPPDTLSLICVWYALLLEEMELNDGICDGGGECGGY